MKQFRFNLERLLELRGYRERETEAELARALGVLSALERELQGIARDRVQAASERFAPGNGGAEIQWYDLYIRRLDASRDRLLKEAAQAELRVEEARRLYLEASRDRKVLDKLKERRRKEHHTALLKEEAKALDDLTGGVPARNMARG